MSHQTPNDILKELVELDNRCPDRPKRPYLKHNPTAIEAADFAEKLAEYETQEAAYMDQRNEYLIVQNAMINKWRDAVCNEYSHLNHATVNLLMQTAIDKHGAFEFDSIIDEMDDLSSLAASIIAVNKA